MNYDACSDESLILLTRSQNADAFYILTKRYFQVRVLLCRLASAALASYFDPWDLNHVFYVTFNDCLNDFKFGSGSFKSYLIRSLRHAMIREAKKLHLFDHVPTLSLDYAPNGQDTLHDVIGSSGDDPRRYVDYFEEAERLGVLKEKLEPDVLKAARLRLDGMTFPAIAEVLGVSPKKAQRLYAAFKEAAQKIVVGGNPVDALPRWTNEEVVS